NFLSQRAKYICESEKASNALQLNLEHFSCKSDSFLCISMLLYSEPVIEIMLLEMYPLTTTIISGSNK
ncbi:MAG: hypothetical protein QXU18_10585, partial [Thermoplasmatales archaeon]